MVLYLAFRRQLLYHVRKEPAMLQPTDVYRSKNFTASLSDDPSGIWYLDVSCKTERNGVSGRVVGHIPLCLTFQKKEDGSVEAALSVMDDVEDEPQEEEASVLRFPGKKQ